MKKIREIDWKLLLFLLLFLNVKLVVKLAALILIYCLRPNLKFGFRIKDSSLPLFYPAVIGITIFNLFTGGQIAEMNYLLVVLIGICFWIACILAIQQIKLAVEKNETEIIHNTILLFFVINAAASFAVYIGIIIETGHFNPYSYQGNFQKYFMGTGDYIKGITMDTSTTNAVLNAFAVIYFLLRRKNFLTILCMSGLLLTGSNVTNLLLLVVLLFIFIFMSNRDQKTIIVACFALMIVFWIKVSPQNNRYLSRALTLVSSGQTFIAYDGGFIPEPKLTAEEAEKHRIAIAYLDSLSTIAVANTPAVTTTTVSPAKATEKLVIPKDSIHTPGFQHKKDTTLVEQKLLGFVKTVQNEMPMASAKKPMPRLPGKLISFKQTVDYFKQHPLKILTGTGIGNFSSKLAFRATAMNVTGSYPEKYRYINDDFKKNHFDVYSYYFTNEDDLHSLVHSPNATYDQLIAEYGIAGVLAFVFLYIGYFFKRRKQLTYGIPLLLLMGGMFFMEYWFEQLSVIIVLELLLLLNIKENELHRNSKTSNANN